MIKKYFGLADRRRSNCFFSYKREKESIMKKEYVMGNQAIALGAIAAGVNLACGYPGTPSSEIVDTIAKRNKDKAIHVEWSINEKAAMEVAAGASYAGARCLVTMKMMGLNVASDALMSLAYVGVEGGLVVVSADDPGPISSQTEQDTRLFAKYCRIPVFDPASVEEAYEMITWALNWSDDYQHPVMFVVDKTFSECLMSVDINSLKEPEIRHGEIAKESDSDEYLRYKDTES